MEPSRTPMSTPGPAVGLVHRLVEDRTSLDAPAAAVAPLAAHLRGTGAWRRIVTGEVLGHSAHPFLTDLPIGFFGSAALLDLLGAPGSEAASRRLVGAGLASAPAAALTGWAEYAGLGTSQRRVALVHAGLNVASLGLYAASWAARPRRQALGVALGLAGLSVAGLSAYLGGHLAIGERVGTTAVLAPTPDGAGVL
ncbi:DUF2231 domain-containing protein [Terrabacter sp. 2RAF25]|uniref:DUF2231 domain-containing protein n=1 Tax=Terrabacter sp. 2RAF25 TaxID=3232998 RepID=UPI003F94EFD0